MLMHMCEWMCSRWVQGVKGNVAGHGNRTQNHIGSTGIEHFSNMLLLLFSWMDFYGGC